jgi:hypothetical protein
VREVALAQRRPRVLERVLQLGQPVGQLLIANIDRTGVLTGPTGEEHHVCLSGCG